MIRGVTHISFQPEPQRAAIFLPRGEWNAEATYTRTAETIDFVYFEGFAYEVMQPSVTGGDNPRLDVQNGGGNWRSMGSFNVIVAEAVFAAYAQLAGGIFHDRKLFSEIGQDVFGRTVQWNGTFSNFTPNLLIDFANGMLNVLSGRFRGEIFANSGRIGNFVITEDSLRSVAFNIGLGVSALLSHSRFALRNRTNTGTTNVDIALDGLVIDNTPNDDRIPQTTASYRRDSVSYRNRGGRQINVLGERVPFIMGAFEMNAAGQIGNLLTRSYTFQGSRGGRGWYEITHNIGHTNYIVIATIRGVERRMVTVWSKTVTAFSLAVGNRQGESADAALEITVIGIFN